MTKNSECSMLLFEPCSVIAKYKFTTIQSVDFFFFQKSRDKDNPIIMTCIKCNASCNAETATESNTIHIKWSISVVSLALVIMVIILAFKLCRQKWRLGLLSNQERTENSNVSYRFSFYSNVSPPSFLIKNIYIF